MATGRSVTADKPLVRADLDGLGQQFAVAAAYWFAGGVDLSTVGSAGLAGLICVASLRFIEG